MQGIYTNKGEGFGTKTGKGKPMGGKLQEANEVKQAKANKSTKAKVGKASSEVAKTKRKVSNKKTNAGMKGKMRTTMSNELKKAL